MIFSIRKTQLGAIDPQNPEVVMNGTDPLLIDIHASHMVAKPKKDCQ